MLSTMDKAGRVVIPASVRARLGLVAGPVDIIVDGNAVRIEVPTSDHVVESEGRWVIAAQGPALDSDAIRELRLDEQR